MEFGRWHKYLNQRVRFWQIPVLLGVICASYVFASCTGAENPGLLLEGPTALSWGLTQDHGAQTASLPLEKYTPITETRLYPILNISFSENMDQSTFTSSTVRLAGVGWGNSTLTNPTLTFAFPSATSVQISFGNTMGQGKWLVRLEGVKTQTGQTLVSSYERRFYFIFCDMDNNQIVNSDDGDIVTDLVLNLPVFDPTNLFHVRGDIDSSGDFSNFDIPGSCTSRNWTTLNDPTL